MDTPSKPTFKEALQFWFRLGWISFGGPAGQIAIMHTTLVEQKRWISDKKFLHALNYCMLLPGPEAQQLATYTGWLLHGTRGGLAAGILFIAPSVLILLALSILYVSFGQIAWVAALFDGLKPAVIAIILLALIKIGKRSMQQTLHYVIAFAAFVCIYFLHVPFPYIIFAVILLALLILRFAPGWIHGNPTTTAKKEQSEDGYYLNTQTRLPHTAFSWKRFTMLLALFVVLWITPFFLLSLANYADFWKDLVLFFSQAAFVTFGGAYAVLPYVAQQAVENFHWLTAPQMVDGLALGETTPGPLIMVLAFVGFMGAYGVGGGSLWMGSFGLLATTYFTFLPCFLFIFAGAPIIEHTQQNPKIKAAMSLITAAVTGVILNLLLYFAESVLLAGGGDPLDSLLSGNIHFAHLAWVVISFIAMQRYKIGMIPWLGISALYGCIMYLAA